MESTSMASSQPVLADTTRAEPPILAVRDLRVKLQTARSVVYAVNGVSFDLQSGESLGIVGESGSGKSILCLSIMQLLPPYAVTTGSIRYQGRELTGLRDRELRRLRGPDVAMIFQDPLSSLNPVLTIGSQLIEGIRSHTAMSRRAAKDHAEALLASVGMPDARTRLDEYPHLLSGGMRQRVMIAIALSLSPKLVIADEPTTALDVTVQAQILELLAERTREHGAALILVTHDLGVVAGATERVMVMYGGSAVETADTEELFADPQHPYTIGLFSSLPRHDTADRVPLVPIPGQPPHLTSEPASCVFAPRCAFADDVCKTVKPALETVRGGLAGSHRVACWHPRDLRD
jgi:oligopeptide/dipeptide ABC transporter ATP-binding protein